ncbi:DUF1266 domain-containing protein [Virgibacillus sp. FSP13]
MSKKKITSDLDLFIQGVSALCYESIAIYFNGFRKRLPGKRFFKPILQEWNIHNKTDLDETCKWLAEEGARKDFDTFRGLLRMESDETRKMLIENMPPGEERLPMMKMIDQQMYAIPRNGILALDIVRYVFLTQCGRGAGFISDKEAHERFIFGIRELQQSYSSWEEMITAYAFGKQYETVHATLDFVSKNMKYVKRLLTSPHSPMNRVEWNVALPEV